MDPYPHIMKEAERHGSSFDELLTIPEQDDWIYSDGKSTSCVVFILEMYKEAGLFDPIANSIQVIEFTIKDAYTLKFFENSYKPACQVVQWRGQREVPLLPNSREVSNGTTWIQYDGSIPAYE
ncbi:hypothetical protein ACSBR1_011471 [Camellia fascicularis]